MLPRGHRQESLSKAYVRAIAAQAGVSCVEHEQDFGIDLSLREIRQRGHRFAQSGLYLDLQVKSTTRAKLGDTTIRYDLAAKNYDDLRLNNDNCPRLLVVLVMPDDEDQWLTQSDDELILRTCAYWLWLEDYPPTDATTTIRVTIPKENVFSVTAVQAMMKRLRERKRP